MERSEIIGLLKKIDIFYPGRTPENPKAKLEAWEQMLRSYNVDTVERNFLNHVERSSYPPQISDLIRKTDEPKRVVPDAEKTKEMLQKYEEPQGCTPEELQEQLANLRRILGMEEG